MFKQDGQFRRIHGDCDQYYSDLYWNDLARYDVLQKGPADEPQRTIYTDQCVLDRPDFLKSTMYNEWFAPQDLHSVLLMRVFDEQGVNTIFTVNRGIGQAEFDAHDLVTAHALEPIFKHALDIRRRVAELRLDEHSSTFAKMGLAHLVIDPQRHVLHMNAVADQLLSQACTPVCITQQRFGINDWRSNQRLDELISKACANPAHVQDPLGEMLLQDEHGPRLMLSVYPLSNTFGYGIDTEYAASIVLRPVGSDAAPHLTARLQALFGLGIKETELAVMLLHGCSLQEAAEQRSVKITTVRSQLAGLFHKTGTTRQGQLIALLARLG
ncbi:MAG: helix-turn-helix transcriptional regulator [Burkholderiaceae bacterium]